MRLVEEIAKKHHLVRFRLIPNCYGTRVYKTNSRAGDWYHWAVREEKSGETWFLLEHTPNKYLKVCRVDSVGHFERILEDLGIELA